MSLLNRDSAATQVVPLVGLASIIANIKPEFPETAFIDAFAEKLSFKQTLKKIEEFNPDVLAFSCLTIQINDAAEVAAAAKAGGAPPVTVVGGPHASRVPMD
ncbi:MAG TPA: cobalamin-dependent protein, partial [bacterium]|nr:cobalamin-dependent protein [bacterium]